MVEKSVPHYADTSFIASLYLSEAASARAIETAARLKEPLPITPLLLLEFRNALNLAIKRGEITVQQRNAIWKTFEGDISDGLFLRVPVSSEAVNRHAQEISDRQTPTVGTRSLDLLHLAAAKTLGVKEFLTFDDRQAKAGKAEGLKIRL